MVKSKKHILKKHSPSTRASKERVNLSVTSGAKSSTHPHGNGATKIKVVGIGGCGGNAITRMYDYFPKGVDLIAVNTDVQDLESCRAKKKLYIGKQTTRGRGAGMNPELGRAAAEESREEIAAALSGADMVFLTAGFGGGTGSGATPVIAEIAQDMGILTAAVVTKPFSFEGKQRSDIAIEALSKLKDRVDTYITISNDRIFSVINKETSLNKAFEAIDEVLKNAVLGVAELIIAPGIINVDFADIKTIIQGSGSSIIGVGIAHGKDRAVNAANSALNSPLLDTSIDGARGVLFSVSGLRDITMNEVNEVARLVSDHVDSSAKIIFGTYYDRKLSKGQLKVTLIATGFGQAFGRTSSLFSDFSSSSRGPTVFESGFIVDKKPTAPAPPEKEDRPPKTEPQEAPELEEEEGRQWDIPTFLRKKGRKK